MPTLDELLAQTAKNFQSVSPAPRENVVQLRGAPQQQQHDPAALPRLPTIWAEDLERLPVKPREWIVEDIVPDGCVTGFYGPGAVGKDTVLMQLGAAMISKRRWLGYEVKPGRVLYFNVEDDVDELRRRQAAIGVHYGIRFRDFRESWKLVPLIGADAVLAVFDRLAGIVKPTQLFAAVEAELAARKPKLVIVGNRVNIFSVEQNSDTQARQCLALLNKLATEHRCTVIMPAHPSQTGMNTGTGESGSVQWQNGVRAQVYLNHKKDGGADSDNDARLLTVKKANYGPQQREVGIRWVDGVFVLDTGVAPLPEKAGEDERADAEFLRMLDLYLAEHRPVSGEPSAPNNGPKVFSDDQRCRWQGKRGKGVLKAAMDRLFAAGTIANEESGPPSRRRMRLVRTGIGSPSNPHSNPPSNPVPGLPTPLATHSPYTPSVRAPACESGRARS